MRSFPIVATVAAMLGFAAAAVAASPVRNDVMSFFITSVAPGTGGDLGGLKGADAYCRKLAAAAGSKRRDWHAYLSTQADGKRPAINARDRIGRGPWRNANGVIVANDLAELHGVNNVNKLTALDESGKGINGRGDTPAKHDIMTGSTIEGLAFPPGDDKTCHNYRSGSDGNMQMGHHDRAGPGFNPTGTSWNSSHITAGCSAKAFASRGGAGLFYCFAGH